MITFQISFDSTLIFVDSDLFSDKIIIVFHKAGYRTQFCRISFSKDGGYVRVNIILLLLS